MLGAITFDWLNHQSVYLVLVIIIEIGCCCSLLLLLLQKKVSCFYLSSL